MGKRVAFSSAVSRRRPTDSATSARHSWRPSAFVTTASSWTTPRSATLATARRAAPGGASAPVTRIPHPDPAGPLRGTAAGESSNHGHGHQNEAAFYILEGKGYEIHDDQRYDWEKDDLVFVHTDSVHRHFNPYPEKAVALVVKAKCTFMFMGLIQQGRSGPVENEEKFGPREDWSQVWTPGVMDRKKVIKPAGLHLGDHPARPRAGHELAGAHRRPPVLASTPSSCRFRPAASRASTGRWPTRCYYILEGDGYALMWEVEAEIAEKYYARIAKEPTRHEFTKGDTVYVPQNHHVPDLRHRRHAAARAVLRRTGCSSTSATTTSRYLEDAPEYTRGRRRSASSPARPDRRTARTTDVPDGAPADLRKSAVRRVRGRRSRRPEGVAWCSASAAARAGGTRRHRDRGDHLPASLGAARRRSPPWPSRPGTPASGRASRRAERGHRDAGRIGMVSWMNRSPTGPSSSSRRPCWRSPAPWPR